MTTFQAITSCSRKGWDEYGQRMQDSVAAFWPKEVPVHLYSEDMIPGARSFPSWLYAFKERHVKNFPAHGRAHARAPYNYRFDAVRFAHKTAAVIDAFETMHEDVLIWVDADTVTHAPVTLDFLESLAPTGKYGISWLARFDKYPECGFYMLRRSNVLVQNMVNIWRGLYKRDTLFHLPEWHDSFVLQELVKLTGVSAKSISGGGLKTHHPFINGPLGAVMDHMKGPRKMAGRSKQGDLKIERTEDYWRAK